jgi:hypothetical protein
MEFVTYADSLAFWKVIFQFTGSVIPNRPWASSSYLGPAGVTTVTFSQSFVVSQSNHERPHFDKLSANGSG